MGMIIRSRLTRQGWGRRWCRAGGLGCVLALGCCLAATAAAAPGKNPFSQGREKAAAAAAKTTAKPATAPKNTGVAPKPAEVQTAAPARVSTGLWGRLFYGDGAKFSGALTFNSGLKDQRVSIPTGQDSVDQSNRVNQMMLLSLQYSPFSYWFANVTFRMPVREVNKYSPDFRYSFGYDDWHPNTFSLVYGNYGDNRFFPTSNNRRTYPEQGSWTFAYKFSLPKAVEKHLLIQKGDAMTCQVGTTWVPRFYSLQDNDRLRNKHVLLGGCGYSFVQHYFIRFTAFYYPDSSQQQPWDADYTYSFGYSAYKPGTFSIQYNNYSGTRYPWHKDSNANFREGTVSLIYYIPF